MAGAQRFGIIAAAEGCEGVGGNAGGVPGPVMVRSQSHFMDGKCGLGKGKGSD